MADELGAKKKLFLSYQKQGLVPIMFFVLLKLNNSITHQLTRTRIYTYLESSFFRLLNYVFSFDLKDKKYFLNFAIYLRQT